MTSQNCGMKKRPVIPLLLASAVVSACTLSRPPTEKLALSAEYPAQWPVRRHSPECSNVNGSFSNAGLVSPNYAGTLSNSNVSPTLSWILNLGLQSQVDKVAISFSPAAVELDVSFYRANEPVNRQRLQSPNVTVRCLNGTVIIDRHPRKFTIEGMHIEEQQRQLTLSTTDTGDLIAYQDHQYLRRQFLITDQLQESGWLLFRRTSQ
jgi:hypothetical protein